MTGDHTGFTDTNVQYKAGTAAATADAKGKIESGYEGTVLKARAPFNRTIGKGRCVKRDVPPKPKLRVKLKHRGGDQYKVSVTVAIAGMGDNEASTSVSPVNFALVRAGGRRVHTNGRGIARIRARPGQRIKVSAGESMVPKSKRIPR